MAGRVRDTDRGYKAILGRLRKLGRSTPTVKIGVRAGGGSDLPLIAAVNEFGSNDGHVPERSFLRSTIDENRTEYEAAIARSLLRTITGQATLRKGLEKLGTLVAADVKRKITILEDPPNAFSTIEQKGSDNPLIDTGRLRASIDFEVKGA